MHKQLYDSVATPSFELAMAAFHHFGKSPMGWTGVDKLTEYALDEQYVERIMDLYNYLRSSNTLLLGINPCQYHKFNFMFQFASKSLHCDMQKLLDCYLFLANYSVKIYNYQLDIIEQEIPQKVYISAAEQSAKQRITMLSALLRSYSETLYCDEHTIAGEIYSPITHGEDTYIVRKFTLLRATELREELADCPIRDLAIYIRYKGLTQRPVTSIVGNLLITENMLPHIDAYYVEAVDVDGQLYTVDDDGIDAIISYFSRTIPVLIENYKRASLKERLWMKIECQYYATKPFCDKIGTNWRPEKYDIEIDRIANPLRPLVHANLALTTMKNENEILKGFIELNDPRIHW